MSEEKEEKRGSPKGFFGFYPKQEISIDEALAILGARLKWIDAKIDLYEDDEQKQLKYLDNLSKIAGPLMQAFKLRGIEINSEQDLAKIFEEIAKRREGKKIVRILVE
jgi:hypothetical protein